MKIRTGAAVALILGEQETARQAVQVKSLRSATGGAPSQAEVTWAELPARLADLLDKNT